jgi:hypothetical protein
MRALRVGIAAALIAASFVTPNAGGESLQRRVPSGPVAQQLARLDCTRLTAADVADVLRLAPAPRIVLLQGSIAFVTMEPFARFLIAMGYPQERLRNPRDRALSYASFVDAAALAGALAYDYEQTAEQPMLIGHSQGGAVVIRVLHELAGTFGDTLAVVDPATGHALPRTTIVDPFTNEFRPVTSVRVSFAAALATGWLLRVLLGQWTILPYLRTIPDSVSEFTGFDLPNDPIAGNLLGVSPYVAAGSARVRNVLLPAEYSHVGLPLVDQLPNVPTFRAWIDAWRPGSQTPMPTGGTTNLVHAADLWYSVKRHWCEQAQRLLELRGS